MIIGSVTGPNLTLGTSTIPSLQVLHIYVRTPTIEKFA
jgi:hypothetical protein